MEADKTPNDGSTRRMMQAMAKAVASLHLLASRHRTTTSWAGFELAKELAVVDWCRAIMRSIQLGKRDRGLDVSPMMIPMAIDVVRVKATRPMERMDPDELDGYARHIEHCRKVVAGELERRYVQRGGRAATKKGKKNVTDG